MTSDSKRGRDGHKTEVKQLYACKPDRGDGIFFASMVERDGPTASLRSSTEVSKGDTIYLYPVPPTWDGQSIDAQTIERDPATETAQVTRSSARGEFQIKVLSARTESIMRQYRSGGKGSAHTTMSIAGEIATVQLRGGLSTESAASIQARVSEASKQSDKIVLDLRELDLISSHGVSILVTLIKDFEASHSARICLLIEPDSAILEVLNTLKLQNLIPIHTSREMAVASFYI